MKTLFIMLGRRGDCVCAFPTVRRLAKTDDVTWYVQGDYADAAMLLMNDGTLDIGNFSTTTRPWHGWAISDILDALRPRRFDRVICAQPSMSERDWELSDLHVVDWIASTAGVTLAPEERRPRAGVFPLVRGLRRPGPSPYATIGATAAVRAMQTLAADHDMLVMPEYDVAIAPFCETNPAAPVLLDLVRDLRNAGRSVVVLDGSLGDTGTTNAITGARLFVGLDSGPAWLATLTETPMLVLMHHRAKQFAAGNRRVGFREIVGDRAREAPDSIAREELSRSVNEILG